MAYKIMLDAGHGGSRMRRQGDSGHNGHGFWHILSADELWKDM